MLNKVVLIGYAGADPVVNTFDDGKKVARIRIATSKSIKDDREESGFRQKTQWHTIVGWGYDANRIEKIQKGDVVYFAGEINYKEYTGEDGIKRYFTEMQGETRRIQTAPKQQSTSQSAPAPQNTFAPLPDVADAEFDDLPF